MNVKILRQRGDWYSVVYYVPEPLQGRIAKALGKPGKKREIVRALATKDRQEAIRLKADAQLDIAAWVHSFTRSARRGTDEIMRLAAKDALVRRVQCPGGAHEIGARSQPACVRNSENSKPRRGRVG